MNLAVTILDYLLTFFVNASNFAWIAYAVSAGVAAAFAIWISIARRSWSVFPVAGRLAAALVLVSIPALIIIRGDVSRFEERISSISRFNLVRPQHRSAPVPNAEGLYWFYSFYRSPDRARDLVFCKERVLVERSLQPNFDYTYRTIPSESECGGPLAAWDGAFIWLEEHRAFVDVARDPNGTDFLIAYLKIPYQPAQDLGEFDSIGFQVGPADFGTDPIANSYIFTARDLQEAEVLERLSGAIRARYALRATAPSQARVECTTRPVAYGSVTVHELVDCGGEQPVNVYSEIGGQRD